MRPIQLSMTAFGPFIGTEMVDFTVFGEQPLFLINGDTGAGKTTILDAICFALYGQTTGKEREAVQMRCDYADDNTITSVEFTFELGGEQYRILRVPEQTRAKKSGEGTTTQKARAELWQGSDDETVLVPQKVTDATQKIEELTGLLVDQFRQVMVLPQGQFRRLLIADSKDREQIFSQLFETGIYKKLEDKLKHRASKVESQVRTLKNEQQGVLQTVDVESFGELQLAIEAVTPTFEAARKLKVTKELEYLAALKSLNEATGLDESFIQLQMLSANLSSLEQQSNQIALKEKRLSQADQALKIKPYFTEQVRTENELKGIAQECEVADKSVQALALKLEQASQNTKHAKVLEKNKEQAQQKLELLKSYRERSAKLQQARAALKQIEQAHQENDLALTKTTKQLEQVDGQLQQSELEKQRLEKLLLEAGDVAVTAGKLELVVTNRQRYDNLVAEKERYDKAFAGIVEKGKAAAALEEQKRKESLELDLAWHSGQAAILASQLQQGQPCLVCGSLEHPSPARADGVLPSDAQREAAQGALELASSKLRQAREEYTRLKTSLEALEPQLTDVLKQLGEFASLSLTEARQQYQAVMSQLQNMKQSRLQLDSLDKQRVELKHSQLSAQAALKLAQQQFNGSAVQLQASKTQCDLAQQELPREYQATGKLEATISSTETSLTDLSKQIETIQQTHSQIDKQHATALDSLQKLTMRHEALRSNAELAEKQWHQTLVASVFPTVGDFSQADLSTEQQSTLKAEVDDFNASLQTLRGAIQEREKSLDGKSKPDLFAVQDASDSALNLKNIADHDWQKIDKQLNRMMEAQKSFERLANKQKRHEQEYKVIGTLSNVANGNTGNKISLQRFVLGVLLDDVLLAASSRLALMSKGRYHLLRKEDRAKGGKASGLEMEVEDTYTGKLRAVATLSGGESFLASLSLALGLSDVVQAYAGGIRLETLFIDEGFGSLDADTLDLAITTLIDLRNTGRMVGIISHVSELKEQISMRLDVVSGRQGSKIELVY